MSLSSFWIHLILEGTRFIFHILSILVDTPYKKPSFVNAFKLNCFISVTFSSLVWVHYTPRFASSLLLGCPWHWVLINQCLLFTILWAKSKHNAKNISFLFYWQIFLVYLYSGSIVFLIFTYVFMLRTKTFNLSGCVFKILKGLGKIIQI